MLFERQLCIEQRTITKHEFQRCEGLQPANGGHLAVPQNGLILTDKLFMKWD
jgi:hypothetical protein